MIGSLATHCGAVQVTREKLKEIQPPPATPTWKPVGHSELIDVLEREIRQRSLEIRREAYAVQRDGALLFGVIDLAWRQTDEFAAAVGLRTANDKTLSIQVAVGFRVFVCDNLVFAGDIIALRRKHTARLDLPREIAKAMDRYQAGIVSLEQDIARLKQTALSDEKAKEVIFDVFQQGILPIRFFRPVGDIYFQTRLKDSTEYHPQNLWLLHNILTSHIQEMPPAPAFQATVRLGRLFGLGNGRPLIPAN